ncbi:MAG: pyrimidine 5'-nucleotidase, partial [Alphaproteobacteria bacterium]
MVDSSYLQKKTFDHVDTWVFDLDNTLYSPQSRLFDQIDHRIAEYVAQLLSIDLATARSLQKDYFRRHGTSLRGLMLEHKIDPTEYLDYVHNIDVSVIEPNPALAKALSDLPGRKLIFTNGSTSHARRVTDRLGITHCFEAVFDIATALYVPKPEVACYARFLRQHKVDPQRCAMFEDTPHNLGPAAELGMVTVLIKAPSTACVEWQTSKPGLR